MGPISMHPTRVAVAAFASTWLVCAATASSAAEVKLLGSAAMRELVAELAPAFERSPGHTVSATWTGSEAITKRIGAGEAADIVLTAAPNLDRLIAEGKLVSRVDVAKSGVGIAVRSGLPKPHVASSEALRNAVLAAKSVAYSFGPSGFYVAELFKRLGVADQIKEKVRQPPSGVQVADLLASGEADLGFQQVSELMHAKGVDYLGPLPPEVQHVTVFSGAIHKGAAAPEAAAALVKFLTGPNAAWCSSG